MKKVGKRKYLNSILICAVILSASNSFANATETQNSLLKTDIYKTSKNGVKVNLYTSHPYKEPLTVNKKGNNQYVIYLPGTVNSQTTRSFSKSDVVQSVDVKSQGQGKQRYTKVLITTSKEVEITPQVQTLANSSYKMTDSEYENLMSHVTKKQPTLRTKSKTSTTVQKNISKPKVTKKIVQTTNNISKKTALKVQKNSENSLLNKTKNLITKPKNISKKTVKPQSKSTFSIKKSIKVTQSTKPVEQKTVINKKTVTTPVSAPKPVSKETSKVVQQPVQPQKTTTIPTTKPVAKTAPNLPITQIPKQNQSTKNKVLTKIKNLSENSNLLLLLACGMIPVILLLILVNLIKGAMKIQPQQNINFNTNLDKEILNGAEPTDINLQGNWQDKFKDYVEEQKVQNLQKQEQEQLEKSQNIDTLFEETLPESSIGNETNPTQNIIENEENLPPLENVAEEEILQTQDEVGTENEAVETETEPKLEEEDLQVFDATETNFADEVTDINLNENSDTISQTDEETSPVQDDDFSLDELLNETNAGDEFLGEIENPDDIIDDSEEENENLDENIEQNPDDTDKFVEENDKKYDFVEELPSFDEEQEETETPFVEAFAPINEQVTPISEENKTDENPVKSSYTIDENKGFCLADYENSTNLVGYIGENVFVLKKFNKQINGKITARMSENKGITKSYMVKVDRFKAMVDVKDDNMKVLIEL